MSTNASVRTLVYPLPALVVFGISAFCMLALFQTRTYDASNKCMQGDEATRATSELLAACDRAKASDQRSLVTHSAEWSQLCSSIPADDLHVHEQWHNVPTSPRNKNTVLLITAASAAVVLVFTTQYVLLAFVTCMAASSLSLFLLPLSSTCNRIGTKVAIGASHGAAM